MFKVENPMFDVPPPTSKVQLPTSKVQSFTSEVQIPASEAPSIFEKPTSKALVEMGLEPLFSSVVKT